jgi:RimJ/RimL family protein N-acetyltransferase
MKVKHTLPNGETLTVREADALDAGPIIDYLDLVCGETEFLSFGAGEFGMSLEEEMIYLEQSREADNRFYIVATVDGEIVATLGFDGGRRPRLRHTGEFGITVRKSHWGLGIGSTLLDLMIGWAHASGCVKKINLRVRVDNTRAIQLYEKKGFVVEGTVRRDLCVHGTFHDHLLMGLIVGD